MSTPKPVITFKDSLTVTLNEADLTGKKVGDVISTSKRDVPCSDGLQWCIRHYPAGYSETSKDHVSVFLWVNKAVAAKYTYTVENSPSIGYTTTREFSNTSLSKGMNRFASHEELRPLFRNGKLSITCCIAFDVSGTVPAVPRMFRLCDHASTDVDFTIGSERVPAHKSFLALISPVFQAMFAHNTAESKSGRIDITEFDFATVKAAIDFCYGHELKELSTEIAVKMLRFADKYLITAVIEELEKPPLLNLTTDNFALVVHYAYDCNKETLLADCYTFFKEHQDEIKSTDKFAELPPALVVHVLKSAFELKTDFDVLLHAHKNDIDFLVDYLEKPLLESISLDNFCSTVEYAWNCSRQDLKQACAKYLNEHRDEVLKLDAYYELDPLTALGVLKAGHALERNES